MVPKDAEDSRTTEAKSRAVVLEMIGDLPEAEAKPPSDMLFVCKLNPVTSEEVGNPFLLLLLLLLLLIVLLGVACAAVKVGASQGRTQHHPVAGCRQGKGRCRPPGDMLFV